MIECGIFPTGGVMAGGTYCAELAVVGIDRSMTGYAFTGSAFEYAIDVAGPALNARVRAG